MENTTDNYLTTLDIAAALLKISVNPNSTPEPDEKTVDLSDTPNENDMIRLFMNIGSMDRIQPRQIMEIISGNTGLPHNLIGSIEICEKFTFVSIPKIYADEVMSSLKSNRINGRRLHIEKANRQVSRKPFARSKKNPVPR